VIFQPLRMAERLEITQYERYKRSKIMKVLVSSTGDNLEAEVSPIFGRCPFFILVDSDTMQVTALPNAAISASGGAGIQASQFVIQQGAQVVLSGNLGPNAMQVLQAAGIPFYPVNGGTVREAVEAYKSGQLQSQSGPTVSKDFGKPAGGQRGGGGMGRGRGGMGGQGRGGGGLR